MSYILVVYSYHLSVHIINFVQHHICSTGFPFDTPTQNVTLEIFITPVEKLKLCQVQRNQIFYYQPKIRKGIQ